MTLELQASIGRRMRAGSTLDDIEAEIIDRCGLGEEHKAALWLYAWSFVPRPRQRAEAGRLAAYLDSDR